MLRDVRKTVLRPVSYALLGRLHNFRKSFTARQVALSGVMILRPSICGNAPKGVRWFPLIDYSTKRPCCVFLGG